MRHLIVGFTPFHAFFAERLIDHLDGEVFCLFTKGWPDSNKSYSRLGFFVRKNRFLQVITYLFSFFYYSFWVRWNLWVGGELHVYVPHPSSVFTNFVFFSKRVSSVNIYEDGLLNYYDVASVRAEIPTLLRLLSYIFGLPVRRFKGHLAGYDARRVDKLYVSRAAAAVAKEKVGEVVQLSGQVGQVTPIPRRILFLDQNVDSFLSSEQRRRVINRMFELYPLERYSYFYKGHHDYCPGMEGMAILKGELSAAPAERIVKELRPEVVISFYSSALLNIASLYPGFVCVSLAACFVRVERDGVSVSLASVFEEAKVFCLGCEEDTVNLLD